MVNADKIEAIINRHSHELHSALAKSTTEGRCYLIIDPTLWHPKESHLFDVWLKEHPAQTVPIKHHQFDDGFCPLLIALDSSKAQESELIRHSLELALCELDPALLKKGMGRSIGGWIVSHASIKTVRYYLANLLLQSYCPGHSAVIRLYDPAVLWAWNAQQTPDQRNQLLGPIEQWWHLDPLGHLQSIHNTAPQTTAEKWQPPCFTPEHWQDLDTLGAINRAMQKWVTHNPEAPTCTDIAVTAWKALRRARQYGFHDGGDLTVFIEHALLMHPEFDLHARVATLISQRKPNDYFNALIAPLTEDDWQIIHNHGIPANFGKTRISHA